MQKGSQAAPKNPKVFKLKCSRLERQLLIQKIYSNYLIANELKAKYATLKKKRKGKKSTTTKNLQTL